MNDTNTNTLNTACNDPVPSTCRPRGRTCKADAKTTAERSRDYRARLKSKGLKEVKCHLDAEQLAYLNALRTIHNVTISEAVSLALTALIRGEMPKPRIAA